MALDDTLRFLQQRVQVFDPTISVEEGSDFYTKVLAPLAQRLGPDPFTTDTRAFLLDILRKNFPSLALDQLDALTEALVLPIELVLGPTHAEITRVGRSLSMLFPETLTNEEADALGANHLQERRVGQRARGLVRVYFTSPQPKRVDLTHVFVSERNLQYVPVRVQSILAAEMLFNTEGGLYYMPVDLVAAGPGQQYNLEPRQPFTVQNLPGAVKVSNPARFTNGLDEQTGEEFLRELPEKTGAQGMTQPTGIISTLSAAFPAITRIAVVGHGHVQMQRDLLQGESLGRLLAGGVAGRAVVDNRGRPYTTYFSPNQFVDGVQSFLSLGSSLVLTVISASFLDSKVRDVKVKRVLGDNLLELEEAVLPLNLINIVWTLRARELRISKAPGLLPGEELSAPPDRVHVGGAVDTYLRAATLTPTTTVIDTVDDNSPVLQGNDATGASGGFSVLLNDLVLGTTYLTDSVTQDLVQSIWEKRWALQILTGPAAGVYDVLDVTETSGAAVELLLYTALPAEVAGARWRILDDIDIDLRAPRLLLWRGGDLESSQGLPRVTTTSLHNFLDQGVEAGDILEILSGQNKGVYTVLSLEGAGSTTIVLNQPLTLTGSAQGFLLYRESTGAPLETPIVRVTDIELLDIAGQSLGVKVPYGRCLGAVCRSLTNPGRGVKLEVPNALLGLISESFPAGVALDNHRLTLFIEEYGSYTIVFDGTNPFSVDEVATQINAQVGHTIATAVGDRVGIFPLGTRVITLTGPDAASNNAIAVLFGARYNLSTQSIRSSSFTSTTFSSLNPAISTDYDIVQFLDGTQVGVAGITELREPPRGIPPSTGLYNYRGLMTDRPGGFFPEADVRMEIGARSVGVVRAYFLDPVTVEALASETLLTYVDPQGSELLYRPDPGYTSRLLPAAPRGTKPLDGNCVGGDNLLNTTVDFRAKRIRRGDRVVIDYQPIIGTAALPDPVPLLAGTTLLLSFGSAAMQRLTFVNDDPTIASTSVTRDGVLTQLNRVLGAQAAALGSGNELELNPQYLLVIAATGTANAILGLSTVAETSNQALNAGTYTVDVPGNLGCSLDRSLSLAAARMQYRVERDGSQRVGVTTMSEQGTEAGMYYADIEVVSEGTGDRFNLPEGSLLSMKGYYAEGYDLSTADENKTFSPVEEVHIHLPRQVNSVGTNDDPAEATVLWNVQVQVTADAAPEVRSVMSFLLEDGQRDVCASPLALALTPHLICFDMDYTGGPEPEELHDVFAQHIHALFPNEELAVDDLVTKARQAGVTSITMPLRLFAVVVDRDRQLRLLTSQDRLAVSQQAAFYPFRINLRRRSA